MTACDHARIRRRGRVDGMRDVELACARSYRLGATEGTLRAVLGLTALVVVAAWLAARTAEAAQGTGGA